jgi:hypothetical protein
MAPDVIATNAAPGDNSLASIFGSIGTGIQNVTNQIAALQAQNDDIAHQRFTLNNLVYQFQQLTPLGQIAAAAAAAYVIAALVKKL